MESLDIEALTAKELAKHNEYRAKHHAPPLVVSEWLSKGAQKWAEHLQKDSLFQHSPCCIDEKDVGQNIFATSMNLRGGQAANAWYDEVKWYTYGSGEQTFDKTGHFSQVVWAGSQEVGFGFAGGIVVADYYPAGNMQGDWQDNVKKP